MAFAPPASVQQSMGPLRGYSDFFASGFRAVSAGRRRPTSLYSATSNTDTEHESDSPASIFPKVFRTSHRRRPLSMMLPSSQPAVAEHSRAGRRSSLVAFSRLFDRIPFAFGDETVSGSSGKRRSKRFSKILKPWNAESDAQDAWVSTGGPRTPSAPNGGPHVSETSPPIDDPFGSSPESKSFFIDLGSDSSCNDDIKRDSFLSMTTTSNSSQSISLFHIPRRDRPISIQTMPLPVSQSRRSSFQCRGQFPEKAGDSWILEEEEADPILIPEYLFDGYDDAAQIDWRQFHNDLLTVEV